jgi:hypothetical protein
VDQEGQTQVFNFSVRSGHQIEQEEEETSTKVFITSLRADE